MKEIYRKLFDFFSLLKVASLCLASLYLLFWLYRFLNFAYAENLAVVFDFLILPVKNIFETVQVINGSVCEFGYIGAGLFLAALSFVFARCEDVVIELDRKYDLKEIVRKQIVENKVNSELKQAYDENVLEYKYFSVLLKFKPVFLNEVIAQVNEISLEDILKKTYEKSKSLLKQKFPAFHIDDIKKGLFIRGEWQEDFDVVVKGLLEVVKAVRTENSKEALNTEFMLILDAQKDVEAQEKSSGELSQISDMENYNAAMITLPFKIRFELNGSDSAYVTDSLGFSVLSSSKLNSDTEIYLLKSRPKQF